MIITTASKTIYNIINIMQAFGFNLNHFCLMSDNGTSATLFIYRDTLAIIRANDLLDL